jgi:hypothetical protein
MRRAGFNAACARSLRENFRIDENDGEPEIIAKVEHGMRRVGGLEAEIRAAAATTR